MQLRRGGRERPAVNSLDADRNPGHSSLGCSRHSGYSQDTADCSHCTPDCTHRIPDCTHHIPVRLSLSVQLSTNEQKALNILEQQHLECTRQRLTISCLREKASTVCTGIK